MKIGEYVLSVYDHGRFMLDGGAMFGSVPKTLWSKLIEPDNQNRIPMATRSLLVDGPHGRLIVDLGCGDKYDEKARSIYGIDNGAYLPVPGVSDVVVTHLHFDHVGGVSSFELDGSLKLNYPDATHWVSSSNLANARQPNLRERASYLSENISVLSEVRLKETSPGEQVWPGIELLVADGHTTGLQWVKVTDGQTTVVFPSDLCPTSCHLPVVYAMGYDICAEVAMREKAAFLQQTIEDDWIVVFQHDPVVTAGKVKLNEKGRPEVIPLAFPELTL